MSHRLQIAQLGRPVIRRKADDVTDISHPAVQSLIDDMLLTVAEAGGMGVAAPQVYESKRIIILCSRPNARYPYAPEMEPTAIINPEITWRSTEMEKDWEGCLTVPGLRGLVPRHRRIEVRYLIRDGRPIETGYEGFIARVFQHELDHLDGKVFLDRIEDPVEIMMEREWQRMIADR